MAVNERKAYRENMCDMVECVVYMSMRVCDDCVLSMSVLGVCVCVLGVCVLDMYV